MNFLEVKFNYDENLGTVSMKDEPFFSAACKSVKDLKVVFMKYLEKTI